MTVTDNGIYIIKKVRFLHSATTGFILVVHILLVGLFKIVPLLVTLRGRHAWGNVM